MDPICPTPAFGKARIWPRDEAEDKKRLAAIDRIAGDYAKALEAIDLLAKGDIYKWMDWIEKKAYALGLITEKDLIPCDQCKGEGHVPSDEPLFRWSQCTCPGSNGRVISLEAQRRIQAVYPEYEVYDPEEFMKRFARAFKHKEG